MEYDLSKYVFRTERGGYTALFNGLNLRKVYGRTEDIDSAIKKLDNYSEGSDKTIDTLIETGFFVKQGEDAKKFNDIRYKIGDIGISNIVMIVSNECNYACRYCQIEENMEEHQRTFDMPIEIARKALDLYEKNTKPDIKKTISITGGEPLINVPTVKYIIDRVKSIPNARTIMFTNGSLVTEELAEYFAEKSTLMLVSLDGNKEIHDSVRVKRGGSGTFNDSVRGYKRFQNAGCKVGISAVTGIHNVDRMEEVSELFASLKPPSIGLNFGHHLLGKENPTSIPMGAFADILTEFYAEMREKNIFVENISRFITPFYLEQPKLNECQAQGRGFTVDSRGRVGVCKSLLVSDIIYRELDDMPEDISQDPVWQQWANRSPFTLEECVGCRMIGICGGGCTYDSFAINDGNINKIDSRLCDYTENVLEFLMWDLFKDIRHKIDGIYVPNLEEQERKFMKYYDKSNQLQRSVGHEKEDKTTVC